MSSVKTPKQPTGGDKASIHAQKPESETVEAAIRNKIEYYLSKENLQTDSYLQSKMNSDRWVEIAILLEFRGLKSLGANAGLVLQALQPSKTVLVSEDKSMVRPNWKIERKTLIIRDLPVDVEQQEVLDIFSDFTGDDAPTEIHLDVGNWFVSFSSEEKCVEAHSSLNHKTIRGNPIRARIKSEALVKSFYQPPPVYPMYQGGNFDFNVDSGGYFVPEMMYAHSQYGRGGGQSRGGGGGGRNGRKNGKKRRSQSQTQPLQLGPTHFPPLPTKKDLKDGSSKTESFTQYTNEDLIQIFESIENFPKPEFLVACEIILPEADRTAHSKVKLTSEERTEVFLHVDHADRTRTPSVSMSPFISPYFSSVPHSNWPSEDSLTPPATHTHGKKQEGRVLKLDRTSDTPATTLVTPDDKKADSEEKGSFRDVLMSKKTAP